MNKKPITYKATIRYRMKETHPDIWTLQDAWSEDTVYDFSDVYTFSPDSIYDSEESQIAYMQRDLALVAGGGYNTRNIVIIGFKYQKVKENIGREVW